jgi:hypothetical protein
MYLRLIAAQRQVSQTIDLDNPDMFYVMFFKNFDSTEVGGFADADLTIRRTPAVVHTDYNPSLPTLLNQDRFVSIKTVHEIGHKLGQFLHHDLNEPQATTYLMVRRFDITQHGVSQETDAQKYPCRLSRRDWNHMNYVYPSPR